MARCGFIVQRLPNKRLLITGGSGFIGTNTVEQFATDGRYQVLNLDIAEPMRVDHRPYWRLVDLLDAKALADAVRGFDPHAVLHLAARTDLGGQRVEDYPANVQGLEHLLDALADAPSLERAVFASSMLVCRVGHQPVSAFDFCPPNAYGESKVAGEKLLRSRPPGCPWTIVRPTSIWGPWFKEPYRDFFDYVLRGRYVHLGQSRVCKTYGYVGNVAYQLQALLKAAPTEVDGRMFYLGDASDYVVRDWAEAIAQRRGIRISQLPMPLLRGTALLGDLLLLLGVRFPMSSFRLKNMTTENRLDLCPILRLAPDLPFTRSQGIDHTLDWMETAH